MSLMYCEKCKKLYGPTVPCPTCGVMGSRVDMSQSIPTNPEQTLDEIDEILWSLNPEEVDSTIAEAKAALSTMVAGIIGHTEYPDKGIDVTYEMYIKSGLQNEQRQRARLYGFDL
jgi:hypothetical protein